MRQTDKRVQIDVDLYFQPSTTMNRFGFLFLALYLASCGGKDRNKTVEHFDHVKPGDTAYFEIPGVGKYQLIGEESEVNSEAALRSSLDCQSEIYNGSDRKKAKLSYVSGSAKTFNTITDLMGFLDG